MRFFVVSEHHGLILTTNNEEDATYYGVVAAVNTGRTVYVHDRQTETKTTITGDGREEK